MQETRFNPKRTKNFAYVLMIFCFAIVAYLVKSLTNMRWIAATSLTSLACVVMCCMLFLSGFFSFGETPGPEAARRREAQRQEAQRRRDLAAM